MQNSFILVGERPVLVNAGMPGRAPKILATLAGAGLGAGDVSLILITHRHVDHIGGAAALRRATGAPVAVHALDADYSRRGDGGPRPPTGWGGRLFDLTGLPGQPTEPCEPDLVIGGDFALEPYGAPAAWYSTRRAIARVRCRRCPERRCSRRGSGRWRPAR